MNIQKVKIQPEKRIILHLDMDAFFAQIEERENPGFKGKPIVVGADPKEGRGRGVVSTANYQARKYGIHSALPISRAYRLCPEALFLPVNHEFYEKVSESIMKIAGKYSFLLEKISIDEAYLDISFLKDFRKAERLAEKLKKEIYKKEKLPCTVGIGPNKLIAKLATNQAKPDGLLAVEKDEVWNFLGPKDIQEIPGIGPKTAKIFREMGINKIKELRNLSRFYLRDILGKAGEDIFSKARGKDLSPVTSEETVKSIGKDYTFEKDTRDPEAIFSVFDKMIREIHHEALENGYFFKTFTVVCRFSGFETHTKSRTLPEKSQDFNLLEKESKKLLLKFLMENKKDVRMIGLRIRIDPVK
jgi:DNA polymerase IV (archaeal DinB-like DNA polymerase)